MKAPGFFLRTEVFAERSSEECPGRVVAQAAGGKPGATVAEQRTITATITEIDPKVPSITFKGPNNWTYSSRVEDKQALAKVKVGDKVDLTWTQAVLIGVETAPKK